MFSPDFADDLRYAVSWGILPLGFICLFASIGNIWLWKEDKPKDEKFFFITGIFFGWVGTCLGRTLFLLNDGGAILNRTEHLLTAFNLCFVFTAGVFYCRALTQHYKRDLWRWALFGSLALSAIMYVYRLFWHGDAS